jgi:lipoprotein-anchoring transpeptidase ErfK/SrfK
VTLTASPYKILIDLATRRLTLFKNDRITFSAPAGVGTATDPTPTGNFFVALFAAPPSSGYGPFVLVSSAHSNTISDWEMSGDALMAIHGPLGDDAEIGTTGAYISHGCVRLHVSDLVHLRDVPAGSPIVVVAG